MSLLRLSSLGNNTITVCNFVLKKEQGLTSQDEANPAAGKVLDATQGQLVQLGLVVPNLGPAGP
jgi:hypothetical protein